jgi:hypothetical protein
MIHVSSRFVICFSGFRSRYLTMIEDGSQRLLKYIVSGMLRRAGYSPRDSLRPTDQAIAGQSRMLKLTIATLLHSIDFHPK